MADEGERRRGRGGEALAAVPFGEIWRGGEDPRRKEERTRERDTIRLIAAAGKRRDEKKDLISSRKNAMESFSQFRTSREEGKRCPGFQFCVHHFVLSHSFMKSTGGENCIDPPVPLFFIGAYLCHKRKKSTKKKTRPLFYEYKAILGSEKE